MTARFSRLVGVRRLSGPETVSFEANASEREALAAALDVLSVDALRTEVTVRPWRSEGVRVVGTVEGALTQACVVTLDPVRSNVAESFDVRLHPDVSLGDGAGPIVVDPEAEDPPEPLDGDVVDVGAIALEHFALGIPPYPRVDGVAFDAIEDEDEAADPSPFAVLKGMRDRWS